MVPVDRGTAITGATVASAVGNSIEELRRALGEGRTGLSRRHRFSRWAGIPLGEVALGRGQGVRKPGPYSESGLMDRVEIMALGALEELAEETDLFSRYRPEELGLFLGSTTAGIEASIAGMHRFHDREGGEYLNRCLLRSGQQGSILSCLGRAFPISGPSFVFSSACSAAAAAISEGQRAVRMGLVKAAIAGGFDQLVPITVAGFDALQILDYDFCRPFEEGRKGINLAEGGGLLLLEACPVRQPLAFLAGAGASNDAYHMTHPDPEGRGMELAMLRALDDAGMTPDDVDYVNAHGTGTVPNDDAELVALKRVFEGQGGVVYGSTKSIHGHLLGGSGAIEAVVSILALCHQQIWEPSATLEQAAPRNRLENVLSNSFGFGGSNVSLVFSRSH